MTIHEGSDDKALDFEPRGDAEPRGDEGPGDDEEPDDEKPDDEEPLGMRNRSARKRKSSPRRYASSSPRTHRGCSRWSRSTASGMTAGSSLGGWPSTTPPRSVGPSRWADPPGTTTRGQPPAVLREHPEQVQVRLSLGLLRGFGVDTQNIQQVGSG